MGRKWKKNKRKNAGNDNKNGNDDRRHTGDDRKANFHRTETHQILSLGNFKMEAYYAYQGIHALRFDPSTKTFVENNTDEEKQLERKEWSDKLKTCLPASFRIGMDVDPDLRDTLVKELDVLVGKKLEIKYHDTSDNGSQEGVEKTRTVEAAKKLPFVPNGYQLSVDRKAIRRNESLKEFFEWIKVQTDAGFVTRQETVSMIPPVLLDPQRGEIVLDMCAAPGSKTSQLLEMVNLPMKKGDTEPSGLVIANDADAKRAYLLVHQMRRINSPAIYITHNDAQFFPLLRSEDHPTEGICDRVLCDVPCSGDGTARKNIGIWKRWHSQSALSLHTLQLTIGLKGAQLTKVGGHMCYSTCSMNPIENESVVAELLRASEGSLELVDKRPDIEGLYARPGMTTWKVLMENRSNSERKNHVKKNNAKMQAKRKAWEEKEKGKESTTTDDIADGDKKQAPFEVEPKKERLRFQPTSMDDKELKAAIEEAGLIEYEAHEDVPEEKRRRIRKSCFPPSTEELKKFKLERCLRIMPQDMDTGGFFVAILKKVAPMNSAARERFQALLQDMDNHTSSEQPTSKKPRIEKEELVDKSNSTESNTMSAKDESNTGTNQEKYSGPSDKKTDDLLPVPDNIFAPLRDYYGLSTKSFDEGQFMVKASGDTKKLYFVTKTMKKLFAQGIQDRATTVSTGLKAFVKNNKESAAPYRVAQEGIAFIAPHMTKRKLSVDPSDFDKCLATGNLELASFSDEFANQVRPFDSGSFVVQLQGYEDDYIKKLVVTMWRCRGDNITTLVNQADIDGMKSKLRAVA